VADLDDRQLWRGVDATVLDVLLPAIPDDQPWARAVAVQLVGLARYAARRPADESEARIAELADVLDRLAGNPLVVAAWQGDRAADAVLGAAGAVLAAAVGRDDPAAGEVGRILRPVVVRQLDDELAATAPLVDAFRGRLDG
jgi:hypothetical protein